MTTNGDLTIFNKVVDPVTRNETLSKAYVYGVMFVESHGANIIASGLESADSVKIYIPFTSLESASKKAVSQKLFTNPESEFTFERGAVVMKGIYTGLVTDIRELEKNNSRVYTLTTVDVHDYGSRKLWHIEVGGE